MSTVARHLGKDSGYSCQTWLSTDIADRYFGSRYRTWFSTSLNPQLNGSSSNPLILFQELDRIVHTNDYNHSTADQLKIRLSRWMTGSSLPPADVSALLAEVAAAPMPAFRPFLWKIDLRNIHVRRMTSIGQFPDEYLIGDLLVSEVQVIVP